MFCHRICQYHVGVCVCVCVILVGRYEWVGIDFLVGGFNPSEKYARRIGSFPPKARGENKNCLKPPPR